MSAFLFLFPPPPPDEDTNSNPTVTTMLPESTHLLHLLQLLIEVGVIQNELRVADLRQDRMSLKQLKKNKKITEHKVYHVNEQFN